MILVEKLGLNTGRLRSGAAVEAHLSSNLTAGRVALSSDSLERLQNLAQKPADYWAERAEMTWN